MQRTLPTPVVTAKRRDNASSAAPDSERRLASRRAPSVERGGPIRNALPGLALGVIATLLPAISRAQDFSAAAFPYFQYLIDQVELDTLTPENRNVLLRPYVAEFWFNPTYLTQRMTWYRQQVPGAKLGRYFVPYNATPVPLVGSLPNKMSNIPDAWLLRDVSGNYFTIQYGTEIRRNLDLTKPEVRAAQIAFWQANSAAWDHLLLDHFIYKYTTRFDSCAPGRDAWFAAMLALIREYKLAGGKPVVINVIGVPWEIWDELMPWVDGFFSESALNMSVYFPQSQYRLPYFRQEIDTYRRALNAGKAVLLTNNNSWAGVSNDWEYSTPQRLGPVLSAAVCLVRNPGERMYFNTNVNLNHDHGLRDYHLWWQWLGNPKGPYVWTGTAATREFSNGSITFDLAQAMPRISAQFATCLGHEPCDMNCDGSINLFDVEPFARQLELDPPARCSPCAADMSGDGTTNQFDIQGFLNCLWP